MQYTIICQGVRYENLDTWRWEEAGIDLTIENMDQLKVFVKALWSKATSCETFKDWAEMMTKYSWKTDTVRTFTQREAVLHLAYTVTLIMDNEVKDLYTWFTSPTEFEKNKIEYEPCQFARYGNAMTLPRKLISSALPKKYTLGQEIELVPSLMGMSFDKGILLGTLIDRVTPGNPTNVLIVRLPNNEYLPLAPHSPLMRRMRPAPKDKPQRKPKNPLSITLPRQKRKKQKYKYELMKVTVVLPDGSLADRYVQQITNRTIVVIREDGDNFGALDWYIGDLGNAKFGFPHPARDDRKKKPVEGQPDTRIIPEGIVLHDISKMLVLEFMRARKGNRWRSGIPAGEPDSKHPHPRWLRDKKEFREEVKKATVLYQMQSGNLPD